MKELLLLMALLMSGICFAGQTWSNTQTYYQQEVSYIGGHLQATPRQHMQKCDYTQMPNGQVQYHCYQAY